MATEAKQCPHCQKELTQQQIRSGTRYCSRSCYADARWGEPISFGKLLTRSKAFIEVAKLCQTGLTQAEAARLVGLCPSLVYDWFKKYGTDAILRNRVCAHCGKSLSDMKYRSNRKYCGRSCESKAAYLKKHPNPKHMRFDPELRAKALEMYWGGLEGSFIAKHLNISTGTAHGWIHDFGHLRQRRRDSEIMALLPPQERFTAAQNEEQWQRALRANTLGGETAPVILVCEAVPGNASVNYLATIVMDTLSCNPCDGRIYAFCSQRRNQVLTVCRTNDTYHLTKTPKSQGTYFWPEPKIGKQIIVQKNEFDYLLTLRKKRGRTPYFP